MDWIMDNLVRIGSNLEELFEKHSILFVGDYCMLIGKKARIHIEDTYKPSFLKARKMTYMLWEKLENWLKYLVEQDIITLLFLD